MNATHPLKGFMTIEEMTKLIWKEMKKNTNPTMENKLVENLKTEEDIRVVMTELTKIQEKEKLEEKFKERRLEEIKEQNCSVLKESTFSKKYHLEGDFIIDKNIYVKPNGKCQEDSTTSKYSQQEISYKSGGAGNLCDCLLKLGIKTEGYVNTLCKYYLPDLEDVYSVKTRYFEKNSKGTEHKLLFRTDKDRTSQPIKFSNKILTEYPGIQTETLTYNIPNVYIISDYSKGRVNIEYVKQALASKKKVYVSPKPELLYELSKLDKLKWRPENIVVCNKLEFNNGLDLYIKNTQPYGQVSTLNFSSVANEFKEKILKNFKYLIVTNSEQSTEISFLNDYNIYSSSYVGKIWNIKIPVFSLDKVVDSTGAGDAFFAALIYALEELNLSNSQSVLYANAAGYISVQYPHCYQPTYDQIRVVIDKYLEEQNKKFLIFADSQSVSF